MTPEQRAVQAGDSFVSKTSWITADPNDVAEQDPRATRIRQEIIDIWAKEEGISSEELEAKYSMLSVLSDRAEWVNTSDRSTQGRDATNRLSQAEQIFNESQGMTLEDMVNDGRIQDVVEWKYFTDAQIKEMGINPTDVRPQGISGPRGGGLGFGG